MQGQKDGKRKQDGQTERLTKIESRTDGQKVMGIQTERHIYKNMYRQMDRKTDTQKGRQTQTEDRETRQTDRMTGRKTD